MPYRVAPAHERQVRRLWRRAKRKDKRLMARAEARFQRTERLYMARDLALLGGLAVAVYIMMVAFVRSM